MQPWHHAQLSARRFGGDWTHYLDIHEFIDMAKVACPDLRHRIVLHNSDLGGALLRMAFPDREHCDAILAHHVREDVGGFPELAEWLSTAHRNIRWPARQPDIDQLIAAAAEKVGLEDPAPVKAVLNLLTLPGRLEGAETHQAFGLLLNGFGPVLVRRVLGPARAIRLSNGREVVFDPSWVAEGLIVAFHGRIPTLGETLSPFDGHLCK
jgi:hypothetical protein